MHWHVPALSRVLLVRKQLVHKVAQRKPALLEHALLAILAEHDVLLGERRRSSHRHGLLASRHHVEAQAALALGVEHDQVHDGHGEHVAVELDDLVVAEVRLERRIHDDAALVDSSVRGQRGVRLRLLEGHGVAEGRLDGAGKHDVRRVGALRNGPSMAAMLLLAWSDWQHRGDRGCWLYEGGTLTV